MQITTKFDIGQEVTRIYMDMNGRWGAYGDSRPVEEIVIRASSTRYLLGLICWNEADIFPTRAEAEAEAARRNGEVENV